MISILLKDISGDRVTSVSLERGADGTSDAYCAKVDGVGVDVEIVELNESGGLMRIHGRMTPFHYIRQADRIDIWAAGRTWSFEPQHRVARRASGAAPGAAQDSITAPMPGTILKINVSAGETYQAHQPLVVMESMKMEMTLSAAQDGRIREVLCAPGQLVEMGAVLARLEHVKPSEGTGDDGAAG